MKRYLKIALSDFINVASPFATSKSAAQKVVSQLKPSHKFIVEFGAGDGAITKELLKFIPADGKLVSIEINKDFVKSLNEIQDKRLVVVSGDVREISSHLSSLGLPQVDAVVSGIPFSFFKKAVRQEITTNTFNSLSSGGVFVAYQITPNLLPIIKKVFEKKVKLKIEIKNIPPYFIMVGKK